MSSFKALLRSTYKSADTEEGIDIYFTRPIGLLFALFFKKIGWSPNAVTILSYFIGETAVKELQVKMQYAHLMSK